MKCTKCKNERSEEEFLDLRYKKYFCSTCTSCRLARNNKLKQKPQPEIVAEEIIYTTDSEFMK
jgi:hypothetical protein